MSYLVSIATGNFTTAGTWQTGANFNDTEASSILQTTGTGNWAGFNPGVIAFDRICLKIKSRSASPSGTFTVEVYNITGAVVISTLTVNVADLPVTPADTTNDSIGWICFLFPSTQNTTTNIAIRTRTSASSQVTMWSSGATQSSATPAYILPTTTTAAPAAGDNMCIIGNLTGAGTGNDVAVTMDNTATTIWGDGTTAMTTARFTINQRGSLVCGVASATNYYLKLSSWLRTYSTGILTFGSNGAEIPRDSTATIEFSSTSFGAFLGGTSVVNIRGLSRTSGKEIDRCYVNSNAAAAATTINVDTDTGWLNADRVTIASTTRTYSQCETKILSGGAGASSFVITVALSNAHSGTSPTQAEVILLSRNVVMKSGAGWIIGRESNVTFKWVRFDTNGVGSRGSIEIQTTTGTSLVDRCAFETGYLENVLVTGTTSNNYTIQNCVSNGSVTASRGFFKNATTTGTAWTVTNCWQIGDPGTSGLGFQLLDLGGTFTNNVAAGLGQHGFYFNETHSATTTIGTLTGNAAHSNAGTGFVWNTAVYLPMTISGSAWRNSTAGLSSGLAIENLTLESVTMFGNTTNVALSIASFRNILFSNGSYSADSTFSVTNNISIQSLNYDNISFNGCNLSVASGIYTACTNDIALPSTVPVPIFRIQFNNVNFGATNEITNLASLRRGSCIRIEKKDNTSHNNITYYHSGNIQYNNALGNTAVPSLKMTPLSATNKLESAEPLSGWFATIASGATVTASVYINKNASYNGNQPRLMVRRNDAIGITADTVIATYSSGTGSWNQISGATPTASEDGIVEFYVDCDGTAGYISVDDFVANSITSEMGYWYYGIPNNAGGSGGGASGPSRGHWLARLQNGK